MINWTDSNLKLSQLEPWAHNPKSISKSAVKRFLSWWKRIGQFQNLAVGPANEQGLHPLYDGHQRLSILLAEYGADLEIAVKISDRPLTEDERAEFVIMAHTGTTGEYDWDILSGWDVNSLQSWGLDDEYLSQLNRDTAALIDMMGAGDELVGDSEGTDTEPQIDKAEELREKWGVESGQLWGLGKHRLICGDCTDRTVVDRVMGGEKADVVLTDVPYGIDYSGGRTQTVAKKSYGPIAGDKEKDISNFVSLLFDVGASDIWCFVSPINLLPALIPFDIAGGVDGVIVWNKKRPGLGYQWIRRQCEFALFWTNRPKPKSEPSEFDLWEIPTDPPKDYQHGTQKPVALMERCLKFSSFSERVFDPFLGSGTTMVAANNLGRRCFGVEIEPSYVAVTLERMSTLGVTPVLVEEPTG